MIKYLTTVNAVLQRVRSVAHNMRKTSQFPFDINTVSSGSKSLSICIVSDWTLETRKTLKTYSLSHLKGYSQAEPLRSGSHIRVHQLE